MTIYITSVRISAERLAAAKDRAHKLVQATQDAFGKAATYQDPHLSVEGVTAKRATLRETFQQAAKTDLEALASEVPSARKYLAEQSFENTRLPQDTASLMQAQMRWDQVRMRLDAGHDFREILKTADEATAQAIAEYAPAWIAAHTALPTSLQDLVHSELTGIEPTVADAADAVQRLVYARIAGTTTDPLLRELLTAEVNAQTQVAVAQPWIDAAGNLIDGGHVDTITAAIASQMAAQTSSQEAA